MTVLPAHCKKYLNRFGVLPEHSEHIAASSTHAYRMPVRDTLATLHYLLAGAAAVRPSPAYGAVASRLEVSYAHALQPDAAEACSTATGAGLPRLEIAPPLNRGAMVPHPWGMLNPVKRWLQSALRRREHWVPRSHGQQRQPWPAALPCTADDDVVDGPDPRGKWQSQGNIRRLVLLALMLGQTAVATYFMAKVLPYQGSKPLEIGLLGLFAILFCWVSAGFWTALAGLLVMLRGTDQFSISAADAAGKPLDAAARTAIVMPICNEDVTRVMAGLRATYASIAQTGDLAHFDFFILSDSTDPDICAAEIAGWGELCRAVNGSGRIFYRRRQRRVKRKSGNIDDFCRRWGKNYRYMLVLDADSVMSGSCVTTLVRLMEASPGAGIIQTAPRAAGRETLYARIQQFASRVYGPLFTAGLHYWQLGESHYWGHNAIIRIAPFMAHCALAPLPGRGSLSGEILSHDFVEAALMRRAGWGVWIAYDLDGSYEEMPPNLLDELKRDRRWCHGNLMNFRLFAARGMHAVHRAVFVTGVMAYLSAPLWFAFLLLSTVMLAQHTLVEPEYFVSPRQLFPIWPQWHPDKAVALFSATATLLLLPKLLAVLLVCRQGAQQFGGRLRVVLSMLLELVFSMLLAPVRMLFHTHFVVAAFLGWTVRWKSPPRHDSETTWREALRKHGLHQLTGLAWGGFVFWLNPSYLPWLLPIAGALVLSVPISVWSSRVAPGRRLRAASVFVIPEEVAPPAELQATYAGTAAAGRQPDFADAVVDPGLNALICATTRPRRAEAGGRHQQLLETALHLGPDVMPARHKELLLNDPVLLSRLHFDVWHAGQLHAGWRAPLAAAG